MVERKHKYCSYELIYKLIKEHVEVNIENPTDNKFKVRYLHPDTNKYYVCIVLFINDLNSIRIITTHPERRNR
ncbi:MAG: hypothetical protein LBR15_01490 [Methanobrevibacter sp.]|nr:hypothetical protein [Candidatus Methanovirga australis]